MHSLKSLLSLLVFALNIILSCSVLYVVVFLKIIIPISSWRRFCSKVLTWIAENWIAVNNWSSQSIHKVKFDVRGWQEGKRDQSYLVFANHQSWVDIFVLQKVFNRKVPFFRFFIKRELIWTPFLGPAWWALDYPMVYRHSKEYLEKHPEKKGVDLRTTQKACEKFKDHPTSIISFVEGTRWTKEKSQVQKSPYKNLLNPKTGGVAKVLQAMGEQFDSVIDVTIIYPEGAKDLFALLVGKIPRVIVDIRKHEIPQSIVCRLKSEDESAYSDLKKWLSGLWMEKDQLISAEKKALTL